MEFLLEKRFNEKALIDSIKSVFDDDDDEEGKADEKMNKETCNQDEIKKMLSVFDESDEEGNNEVSQQHSSKFDFLNKKLSSHTSKM